VPFPDGYGATVHFFWPGKGFQLLGMLSNEKPSAIFRLRGTFSAVSSNDTLFAGSPAANGAQALTALLGLSIEPLPQIIEEVARLPSAVTKAAPTTSDATLMAERIVKHLFNYISSFVTGGGGSVTPETQVPMALIAKWYEAFMSKVQNTGLGFLENQE